MFRMRGNRQRVIVAVGLLLAAVTCSRRGSLVPDEPPPPLQPKAPAISCPADITVEVEGTSANVNYPAPTVTDGAAPVTTTCSAAQGASFPAGTTDVTCTARDQLARQAQCTFHVTVSVIPKLSGTRFMAFGDSITCCEIAPPISLHVTDPVHNYSTVLEAMLRARYKAQTIAFAHKGQSNRHITDEAEQDRLVNEIDAFSPVDALLLLEGANDLNDGFELGDIAHYLDLAVFRAQSHGVARVFLATLPPQIDGTVNDKVNYPELVPPLNDLIRHVAAARGAVLVDTYAAMFPDRFKLIGDDGLHPTIEGAQVIADTFLAAIKANLEIPTPGLTALGLRPLDARSPRPLRPGVLLQPTPGAIQRAASP